LSASAELLVENHTHARIELTRWLQLRFDFDSTVVPRQFDGLSNVIKVTVT